ATAREQAREPTEVVTAAHARAAGEQPEGERTADDPDRKPALPTERRPAPAEPLDEVGEPADHSHALVQEYEGGHDDQPHERADHVPRRAVQQSVHRYRGG